MAGMAEPLFVVVRTDRVRIFVDVPETDLPVRAGVVAQVHRPGSHRPPLQALVTRTSWALDPANRTLRAEIEAPTPTGELRPGMYAYVAITIAHPETWTVPASAVIVQEQGSRIVRVVEGKAVWTPVRTGVYQGALVEVQELQIKGAGGELSWQPMTGKEEIVLEGPGSLADGQPVTGAVKN